MQLRTLFVSNETSVKLLKLTCFVICPDLSRHGYSYQNLRGQPRQLPTYELFTLFNTVHAVTYLFLNHLIFFLNSLTNTIQNPCWMCRQSATLLGTSTASKRSKPRLVSKTSSALKVNLFNSDVHTTSERHRFVFLSAIMISSLDICCACLIPHRDKSYT